MVEVVKECAEEFMFDKRIFALVDGLIEDGVVESVAPIVSEIYYKAAVSQHKYRQLGFSRLFLKSIPASYIHKRSSLA